MDQGVIYSVLILAVISLMTFGARFFPFLLFSRGGAPPSIIAYLGEVLPPSVMMLLIVYCLRNVIYSVDVWASALAIGVVVIIYRIWKNSLIAMVAGTVSFMAISQLLLS
jgi:branched-subunit amino acid transport protein AzlD